MVLAVLWRLWRAARVGVPIDMPHRLPSVTSPQCPLAKLPCWHSLALFETQPIQSCTLTLAFWQDFSCSVTEVYCELRNLGFVSMHCKHALFNS